MCGLINSWSFKYSISRRKKHLFFFLSVSVNKMHFSRLCTYQNVVLHLFFVLFFLFNFNTIFLESDYSQALLK